MTDSEKVKSITLWSFISAEGNDPVGDYELLLRTVVRNTDQKRSHIHVVDEFFAWIPLLLQADCIATIMVAIQSACNVRCQLKFACTMQANFNWHLTKDFLRLVENYRLPAKKTLFGGQILRCINNFGTAAEKFNARFIVPGYRDE